MAAFATARAEGPARGRPQGGADLFCERIILGLVAAMLLWAPLSFGGVPEFSFVVIQGLTVLALLVWVVRLWLQPSTRLWWPPVAWGVGVFLLYALVRCHVVLLEYPARMEMNQVIVYASLFFIVVNNLTRKESTNAIVVCLLALALVLAWYAVYQFATKSPSVWGVARREQYLHRGTGTFLNPNHLACFLGMALALALAYMLFSRFNYTAKIFLGYCVLSFLVGMGATVSRGGLMAAGGMLFIFCVVLLFDRHHWVFAMGGIIVLIACAFILTAQFGALQKRFDEGFGKGRVEDLRKDYWTAATRIFEEHPVWGAGPAHFDAEFSKYRAPLAQIRPGYAHNDYLNTLADWGTVGLAIVIATCGLLFYGAIRSGLALRVPENVVNGSSKSDRAAFLLGASLAVVMVMLHCAVDFNMHIPAIAIATVVLMGLMADYWRLASERAGLNLAVAGKIGLTVCALASVGWLVAQGLRSGAEAYWHHRSGDESASWNDRFTALQKACEVEPVNYENSYNLAEYYRLVSLEGNRGYEDQAKAALQWYAKSMAANPLDPYVPMRYGMCLDWLDQTNESVSYFEKAESLDPNNAHVAYYYGRHFVDAGDLKTARQWFQRSCQIFWNEMAQAALEEMDRRLADKTGFYEK